MPGPQVAPGAAMIALIGAGVIGAGWAARFALAGHEVRIYDPEPDSEARVERMLRLARRAQARLTMLPPLKEGSISFPKNLEETIEKTDFIQESVPEREALKCELLRKVSRMARKEAIIASSTSGLKPSLLQSGCERPQRVCVGHPFHPVYLLPLVEVVAGGETSEETLQTTSALYASLGMHPLVLRTEIDGFVADRLLESVWRESLHLVKDGVATVDEIDQAIAYGPGLRWSIMGSFLLYRLAGGESGMRHFLDQFGPALKLPWTHLEAPELDEALISRIVEQSDQQAEGRTIDELETLRDDCLVSILQSLKAHNQGAGAVLKRHEGNLISQRGQDKTASACDLGQPLQLHRALIQADWIDYNGHLTESRYLQVFGDATDALLSFIGVDSDYLASEGSYFTLETHIRYLMEVRLGEEVHLTTQVLASDEKRIRLFHRMLRSNEEVATAEHMMLHVNAASGRAAPAGREVRKSLEQLAAAQAAIDQPQAAGRGIALH